ncbi:hypothetical protein JZ751_009382 [Albula glossodonta]|uniref:protein-tyrosine-phosphatase n=1 Tax=Albula glossodonta TaxID=121402 RepID=A0A8T2N072_9TELE|nr:hypothetical protein JZ751_009382 [Albula glossodonta]
MCLCHTHPPLPALPLIGFLKEPSPVRPDGDGQSRTIRQFQFTDWPEQGVPKTGEGFIDFIGQVHKTKEQFGQDGPITVHCSAGVGRTGVFITLSIVLERMRYEGVVDLFQTVKTLRTQRPAMVQTEVCEQGPVGTSISCATGRRWSTWGALITMQRNHSWPRPATTPVRTTPTQLPDPGVEWLPAFSHTSPTWTGTSRSL